MSTGPVWRTPRDVRTEQARTETRTMTVDYHPCDLPVVGDGDDWTCPECGSRWRWLPAAPRPSYVERYGFLRLRRRVVTPPPLHPAVTGMWLPRLRTCRLVAGR